VRNLIRAGVQQAIAIKIKITGHKTRAPMSKASTSCCVSLHAGVSSAARCHQPP